MKSRQKKKHYAKANKEEKEQILVEAKNDEKRRREKVWPLLDRIPPSKRQKALLERFLREELM